MTASGWSPGRWWRVTYTDADGVRRLWCETSDEQEARDHLTRVPDGTDVRLERLWTVSGSEWRPVP